MYCVVYVGMFLVSMCVYSMVNNPNGYIPFAEEIDYGYISTFQCNITVQCIKMGAQLINNPNEIVLTF